MKFKIPTDGRMDVFTFGHRREKTCPQGVREQQRRRPAGASAQTDQYLCYSLI